ncbi:MAG TPA: Gfo/Idh/MocA family oxidoreductase [Terriglobia bacterium]|jgi:predicted dehydrogenase|nr:Gfo/Idh/MocA family oxidoreductase [Terriglobia bacterium]
MNARTKTGRRQFLKRAAGVAGASAAFPYIVPSSALGLNGAVAPSDRVTMGFIGVGLMGQAHLRPFIYLPDVQVVAVCDPNRWRREQAQHIVNGEYAKQVCSAYVDFRELVMRRDIDAICIASLDSWHVLHALAAVRAGKDVYVEKPLGMSIEEIKLLREEVNRYGRVFQFGTQQRSSKEFRFACELVRNGRIGKLQSIKVGVHSGAGMRTGPKVARAVDALARREREVTDERSGLTKIEPEPVPEWLDYEMWQGPAPAAPYTTARLTYPHWFHISNYSLGYVSGWGVHHIDIAQWGNGTDATGPIEVTGTAVWPHDDALCDNPTSWDVHYEYANGVKMHYTGSGPGFEGVRHGITFEGTDGWVFVNRGVLETNPKSLMDSQIGPNELHLPVSELHEKNFIECVKSRAHTICPVDVAVRSDTVCQLAWITFKLQNRKLKWDPEKEVFPNDPDANRLMRRTLRAPWRYEA